MGQDPPDLAVEVVSPNDSADELEEKLDDYQKAGVPLVWVVNPSSHTVMVYRGDGSVSRLRERTTSRARMSSPASAARSRRSSRRAASGRGSVTKCDRTERARVDDCTEFVGDCTMRRLLSLPRLALAVWLAWLGLIGLMFVMQARQVWHPRFVPMTGLLVLLIATGLSLIVAASWRLLRGPRRGRALACVLMGTAPLWFMAGHAMYSFDAAYGQNVRLDLPLKMLVPLGGSLMDLESLIRYPRRTEGEKVVMISTPAANSREQVTAMDQHIRQLETRLGRKSAWRTRWVRGPLMGQEGRAIFNLCMGSRPGDGEGDAGSLTTLDRHEVAHCVITSLNAPESEPPAVLVEGWAEANQGTDPTEQAFRAWDHRRRGDDLTLRELIGPDWYWRHLPPAYVQGAALVNYLLRRFGPERFLSLYTTCRPATFAEDCQRVLGVSLAELDTDFWMDIDQIVAQEGSLSRWRLAWLKLGPKVDPVAWKTFLKDYFAATDRLLAPYEHVRMTALYTFVSTDDHGKAQTFSQQIRSSRSGLSRSLWIETGNGQQAYLAHPGRSLVAHRNAPDDPWEVEDDPRRDPERSYRRIRETIDEQSLGRTAAALLSQTEDLRNRVDPESIVVAAFERFDDQDRPLVRVRLEDHSKYESMPWRGAHIRPIE